MSLAFWVCLLSAATLYGVVVLSPKVVRWARRAEDYAVNQQRLINLRKEIQQGERLSREWESTSATGSNSAAVQAADTGQTIQVEDALRYQGPAAVSELERLDVTEPRGIRILKAVSGSRPLQTAGLLGSGALLLVAFTMLTETPVSRGRAGWGHLHQSRRLRRLSNRSRLTSTPDAPSKRGGSQA